MTATTWYLARESAEWAGPIQCAVTDRASGQPVTLNVQFAVLAKGQRPAESDWASPVLDPDGTGGLGVFQSPVTSYQHLGIWARDRDNPETPVLEPSHVGWVVRT